MPPPGDVTGLGEVLATQDEDGGNMQYVGMVNMRELLARIEARRGELQARLRELVEVESPSDSAESVNRAGALVETWVVALGGRAMRHAEAGFGNVLELRFGAGDGGGVLLLGHLDTVWPTGTLATMPWREADGKIYGPGVLDMKAGVVMALQAIGSLQAPGKLQRPVTLLLNPDEEVGSPVSRKHTERLAREAEAVFVLEPAQGLAYKTARKGVGHFELQVQGVSAHAGVGLRKGALRRAGDGWPGAAGVFVDGPCPRQDGERGRHPWWDTIERDRRGVPVGDRCARDHDGGRGRGGALVRRSACFGRGVQVGGQWWH